MRLDSDAWRELYNACNSCQMNLDGTTADGLHDKLFLRDKNNLHATWAWAEEQHVDNVIHNAVLIYTVFLKLDPASSRRI